MIRKPQSRFSFTRATIQKLLFTNKRGRFAALVILALLATAITAITISSAKSKKARVNAQNAKSISAKQRLFKTERGPRPSIKGANGQEGSNKPNALDPSAKPESVKTNAKERKLKRAKPFDGDLRSLPYVRPAQRERPELEEPSRVPVPYDPSDGE